MTISTSPMQDHPSSVRRPRVLEVALILSLALNCFVVGGLVVTAWHFRRPPMPPPEMAIISLAQSAGLSTQESDDLTSLVRSVHLETELAKSENAPIAEAYLAELSRPAPDQTLLAKLETQIRQNKVEMHQKISLEFARWMAAIPPDKRVIIIDRIRDGHDPAGRGLRWIIGM